MAYILTNSSIIMCLHGGIVTHIPMTQTEYRINGELPLLLNDIYTVGGCPFSVGNMPCPCYEVRWFNGSNRLLVKGIPVLTNISSGFCHGGGGFPHGPAMITNFQVQVQEPNTLTQVE